MTKELEALEILKKQNSKSISERYYYPVNTRRNAVNIIEKALQRLEAIDNVNLSEVLVDMERIKHSNFYDEDRAEYIEDTKEYDNIKHVLIKAQKQEKVLEIIIEKDVDMYSLRRCETVEEYNIHFVIDEYQKLTQEEFDLLKRYFDEH